MTEVNTKYHSYVHVSNGGFSFDVEVTDLDSEYGAHQTLTIGLSTFGLPMTTSVWLDDNTLEALEYIIAKAREQRKAFTMTKYDATRLAIPPHSEDEVWEVGQKCCNDSATDSTEPDETPQAVS